MPKIHNRFMAGCATLVAIGAVCSALAACNGARQNEATGDSKPITTEGTVRFVAVEGGCWKIDTPVGSFEPSNLPVEFRTDGYRIVVTLEVQPDVFSLCQVGRVALVKSITRRESERN